MHPEDSLPCTQKPANVPYPEPVEASLHIYTLFLNYSFQLAKKLRDTYGKRRFIAMFTRASHWSLS
jgi:hypothetical protein